MDCSDILLLGLYAFYVVGLVFFAFGYGNTEPEYPKLPAWRAFGMAALWPAWLFVMFGRHCRTVTMQWDAQDAAKKARRQ